MFSLHRPLTYFDLIIEHLRLRKLIEYVDVISEQSETAIKEVRKIYGGRVEILTRGCYFDFWTHLPSQETRMKVRQKFNVQENRTVFLAASFFVPVKQLDKLIKVFQKLSNRDNFFLIIVGQGTESYTNYIRSLARELIIQNKAIFHPFVTGKGLRDLYWASDIFVSVSTGEGGPTSVMKAMACGLPVLCTPVGETSDRMKKQGVGKFVPVKDYDEWEKAILEILDKRIPKILDLRIARDAYDWTNVARKFINLYHDLCRKYY
jgi:Glycosyltransferase